MEAKELRIGNWVNNVDIEIQFDEDDWDCIVSRMFSSTPMDRYQPIPLTEEWLLKFGFKKDSEGLYLKAKPLSFLWDDEFYFMGNRDWDSSLSDKIKHVHQLQNLYFALTGEELTTQ